MFLIEMSKTSKQTDTRYEAKRVGEYYAKSENKLKLFEFKEEEKNLHENMFHIYIGTCVCVCNG